MAALDPQAALEVAESIAALPDDLDEDTTLPERKRYALTLAVTVAPPSPLKRWRFFVFWLIIKLAARVYPFEFEIYRTERPWERE